MAWLMNESRCARVPIGSHPAAYNCEPERCGCKAQPLDSLFRRSPLLSRNETDPLLLLFLKEVGASPVCGGEEERAVR